MVEGRVVVNMDHVKKSLMTAIMNNQSSSSMLSDLPTEQDSVVLLMLV